MIEPGQCKGIEHAARSAGARIPGAEHDAAHTRVHDGGRAHQAGLERDVQDRIVEAVAVQGTGCAAQRLDFGMGGRVAAADRPVCARPDDALIVYQHRADRHLAGRRRHARLRERSAHEVKVGGGHQLLIRCMAGSYSGRSDTLAGYSRPAISTCHAPDPR